MIFCKAVGQCGHIWRNFATLANIFKSLQSFYPQAISSYWHFQTKKKLYRYCWDSKVIVRWTIDPSQPSGFGRPILMVSEYPIRQDLLMKYSTYKTGHIYIPRCTYKDIREPSSCLKWHHKDKYPFNGPTLEYWDHHRQSTFSNFNWYPFCRWIVKRMKIENKRKEAENECFVIRIYGWLWFIKMVGQLMWLSS